MNLAIVLPANILEIFIIYNFWFSILNRRYSKRKSSIIFFTVESLNIIKCMLIFEHVTVKALTTNIVSLILLYILFTDKWHKKILAYTSYMVCVMLAECLAVVLAKYVYHHDMVSLTEPSLPCFLWQATAYLLIFIFSTIALLLLKNKKINPENKVTQYTSLYISVQCLLVFVVTMLIFEYKVTSTLLIIVIVFIIVASALIGITITKTTHFTAKRIAEVEFLKKESKIKDKHFYELREQYIEYKKLRHDFYNHLKIIDQLNDSDKVKEYVTDIKNKFDKMEEISYCNNLTLDALLSIKKSEATQAGIRTTFEICDTKELSATDFDLCIILSNLLDNAIEAASATERKFIYLQMSIKMDRLIITVRNSSLPVNSDLSTTKNDAENHGLGLMNIKSIAQKYDGTTVFTYENSEFLSIVNIKK